MKGDTYFFFQVQEDDGSWALIGAMAVGVTGELPLLTRDPDLVDRLRPLAIEHGKVLGKPVRLATFGITEVEVLHGG